MQMKSSVIRTIETKTKNSKSSFFGKQMKIIENKKTTKKIMKIMKITRVKEKNKNKNKNKKVKRMR